MNTLLTRHEVAERLNVSERTVDRWRKRGWLDEVPVGDRLVMIPEQSLEALLRRSADQRHRQAS